LTHDATSVLQGLNARSAVLWTRIHDLDQCGADELEHLKKSMSTGFDDVELALAEAMKRA
jgi:citrate lyase beta subunit